MFQELCWLVEESQKCQARRSLGLLRPLAAVTPRNAGDAGAASGTGSGGGSNGRRRRPAGGRAGALGAGARKGEAEAVSPAGTAARPGAAPRPGTAAAPGAAPRAVPRHRPCGAPAASLRRNGGWHCGRGERARPTVWPEPLSAARLCWEPRWLCWAPGRAGPRGASGTRSPKKRDK